MYVYESHMGGLYTEDYDVDYDDLYCEECGDSDFCIGRFSTMREFLEYYADNIQIEYGDGGYDLSYVLEKVVFEDEPPMSEQCARDIVKVCHLESTINDVIMALRSDKADDETIDEIITILDLE